mmetsp:Transcript_11511/g.33246  ORF Transcript_11511/g.33246 Transcript_11511/m.33246 type:complete len:173 (+) Transcript_11511:232-750(+)
MITHSQPRSPAFMHQALHPYAVELLTLATSALQPHRNNALFQAAAAEADRRRLDSAASTSSAAPAAAPARETEEPGDGGSADERACVDEARAAAYLVGLTLQQLGTDGAAVLPPSQLRQIYAQLRLTRDGAADPLLREHAADAVAQLDLLGRHLLGAAAWSERPRTLTIRMP